MEINVRFKPTVAPKLRSWRAGKIHRNAMMLVSDSNGLPISPAPAVGVRPIRTFALSLFLVAIPDIVSACPTCKNGLHEDGAGAAFAVSIIFMMAMPFLIVTCWVVAIYRLRVKATRDGLLNIPVGLPTDPLAEIAAN